MTTRGRDIASAIKQEIAQFGTTLAMVDVGAVVEIGDGIARLHGLAAVKYNELLEFPGEVMGIAMNLEEESVSAIIVGDYTDIKEGDEVRRTGRIAEAPVGEGLIGRVVDPLGRPLDGKGPVKADRTRPLERVAPGVTARKSVDTPVQTGVKAIDSMIPLGRGQRELIIGDRSTGKTAIALDTIVNQKGGDLICIYVAIGQKTSKVARVAATLDVNRQKITGVEREGGPGGKYWQPGAFDRLEGAGIAKTERLGSGRNISYRVSCLHNLPLLTPAQVEILPAILQESHAEFLRRASIEYQEWTQLELPTLVQLE